MSVIGIDFGNESCYVAVAKAGGIETIANDYSLRATPSCVAFAGRNRILGVAAKNQQITNMNNTVAGFKRLLGRKYNDPHVQTELRHIPYRVEQRVDGGIGIRVNYLDEEHLFSPEQITAMLFTKLKEDSAKELKTQINDCVITVPSYFTNAERKALLDAAAISGLNVLRLLNETTATALSYGFYKQDLPAVEEKPRNVIFVDCGHAALQVSACAFHKGKLKMIASCSDQVGGRDFDTTLADHFSQEFVGKYKMDPKTNKRAYFRLLAEVEKIKKQMSANSTKLPLNIECFMNDRDVTSSIQRCDMEEISLNIIKRIENTMKRLLVDSKLTPEEIHSVEIVGGTSRIPIIKHLIEQIFNKPASTTLNQDEAVSRGAALQCAIMSPAVRVREFGVSDVQMYPVYITWEEGDGKKHEMKVFDTYHATPFSRLLTVHKKEPFTISVFYEPTSIPYTDPAIGSWTIKDVKPAPTGEGQEIKIKVRINQNGIVLISSAAMIERKEVADAEPSSPTTNGEPQIATGEQPPKPEQAEDQQQNGDQNNQKAEPMDVQEDSKDKKKKVSTKSIELAIDADTHGFSTTELSNYFEQECKMISNDRQEKERVDVRNALEEYVYEIRGKIQEGGDLAIYVTEADSSAICRQLEDIENWLYEDGENAERQVYKTKLSEMQAQTDPIRIRCQEFEGQEKAFIDFGHCIQMTCKAIEQYRNKDPKYDHLTETEILNLEEAVDKAKKWYDEARAKSAGTPKTQDPPVKIADIRHESQTLSTCTNSVLSRPKPKPPTPPTTNNDKPQSEQSGDSQPESQNNQDSNDEKKEKAELSEDKMDVE